MNFRQRLGLWWWQKLICWDQGWLLNLKFPFFVILGRGRAPNADETISSYVGYAALKRKRWALLCQRFIDLLFSPFEKQHCLNAIEWDEIERSTSA